MFELNRQLEYNEFADLSDDDKGRYTRSPLGYEIKSHITLFTGAQSGGKSYAAVREIRRLLRKGHNVAANFDINWQGFDERDSFFCRFCTWLGFKRLLFNIPEDRFTRLSNDAETLLSEVEKLGNCHLFIDEEYELFNSRSKMSSRATQIFLQTNKRGVNFYLVVPYANLVDKMIRITAKDIVKCSSFDLFGRTWLFKHSYHRLDDTTENLLIEEESVYLS